MRILVITSCTGEKAVKSDEALTLEDFQKGKSHLKSREKALAKLQMPASKIYTGQQHVRLMRGVEAINAASNGKKPFAQLELWVLSAGYGLVPGDRKISPYETTFQGMKSSELSEWADQLNVPTDFRNLVSEKYDLCVILLGDSYLSACKLDTTVKLGGQTLLFCGTGMAKKLPRLASLRVVTLSNPEAKRFSCALVGLKGELADRLLTKIAGKQIKTEDFSDPASDLLGMLDDGEHNATVESSTRRAAIANPKVDKVIQIPKSWWKSKHRDKLRYFIPEWDDLVDPEYDFIADEHSGGASDWSNAVYAHQMYPSPNYDGLLVSRVVAEKSKNKKARINELGVHRFLRVPREFPVMGDCGAFGYIKEETPPYTTEDVLDYYTRLDFDYGVSVDHLILTETEEQKLFRYDLTIANAEDFIKKHRKAKLGWVPIGAVQGWDARSYSAAAQQYVKMGYEYIALGGLVRSTTDEILNIVEEVRTVVPDNIQIHLFGVARPAAIRPFADMGINSVDSASVLRQAWMRTKDSYLLENDFYGAIRIPEAGKSFRAKQIEQHAGLTEARIVELEQAALTTVRAFAAGNCRLESCLEAVMEYDKLVTADREDMTDIYRKTLEDRPWERCACSICKDVGIEVAIFRGNNRNRRRGFHNTYVFYQAMQKILGGQNITFGKPQKSSNQKLLFPIS
jgi:hypothetical protein